MKTQKTLILVGLAMSVAMATGCKNESKSAPIVDSAITQEISPEQTSFEIAQQLKAKADAAQASVEKSLAELKEAKKFRDEVKVAREEEGNSVIKDMLSVQVEASIKEVQVLEKNVKIGTDLLMAERKTLMAAVEKLSPEDQAKLGEADYETQVSYEEKARKEMSLEASRLATQRADARVQKLNERLAASKERIAELESLPQDQLPAQLLENERRHLGVLLNDIDEANKDLSIAMAKEDNDAKLFSDISY